MAFSFRIGDLERSRSSALGCLVLGLLLALGCRGGSSAESSEPDEPPELKVSEIDSDQLERLRSLGYVNVGAPLDPSAPTGVLVFDEERAQHGLNLLTNSHFCSAQLMDMRGNILHSWSYEPCNRWGNTVLTPSGDLLVVGREPHDENPRATLAARYIMRLAWDGEILWKKTLPVHHDVELTPDGRILTLTYRHRMIAEVDSTIPVRDHLLALLTPEGEELEEISLWDLSQSAPGLFRLDRRKPRDFDGAKEIDIFHSNSIEWMRHPLLEGKDPIYGRNTVLVCLRNQDTLAIIDWDTRKLIWAWGRGLLSGPHDATVLPNGNILAFDNGLKRKWSRVVEVDPLAREIAWEYHAPDLRSFYTGTRGASQRLSHGNTLITESRDGRAFEVTPNGEIVWEFLNSNLTPKREPSVIVRTRRFEGLDYAALVQRLRSGQGVPFLVD